uniref:Uncharacterized protein n=1 Tax=Nelumbo nucifera TaxID=4432 RepID=A0A822Y212_NELNU|nr:TPA_asm: hypothetical protein HUJ06_027760 [Nelumbo nucifera]
MNIFFGKRMFHVASCSVYMYLGEGQKVNWVVKEGKRSDPEFSTQHDGFGSKRFHIFFSLTSAHGQISASRPLAHDPNKPLQESIETFNIWYNLRKTKYKVGYITTKVPNQS